MKKSAAFVTLFLMIVFFAHQGLMAKEKESPAKSFSVSVNAAGLLATKGGFAGYAALKLNYFVKENWFVTPQLITINLHILMPGIMINKMIKNSFYLGAGGYYTGGWEYKDFFLTFQAGKMYKRFVVSGFIMAPIGAKSLLFGLDVGILLRYKPR